MKQEIILTLMQYAKTCALSALYAAEGNDFDTELTIRQAEELEAKLLDLVNDL